MYKITKTNKKNYVACIIVKCFAHTILQNIMIYFNVIIVSKTI